MTLPYDYYPAVLFAIEKISQGRTKTYACDESNISISVFEQYVKNSVELQELLHEAETRGYDAMADMLLIIDSEKAGIYSQSDPKMAKVISENIKWLLTRRRQKQYGDRMVVEHNLTADRAITDALAAGRNRLLNANRDVPAIIDVTPVESDDDIMSSILA